MSKGPEPTYTYVGSVTIDNPFDYDTDDPAKFKFVLKQDGNNTPIETITLGYVDFPYILSDIQGHSANQGTVVVYRDGVEVASYPISFQRTQA